jgi:hypothetical protein
LCFVKRDFEAKFGYKAGIDGSYSIEVKDKLIRSILRRSLNSTIPLAIFLSPIIVSVITGVYKYSIFFIISWIGAIMSLFIIDGSLGTKEKVINYVGNIPETVLDRIDLAKQLGVKEFMVYSCEPLPTEEILVKTDPVMIGWLDDNETGVVIGIWDRDKEINVLD